ncbi:MAG: transmembrane 220 family protein [Longimicrobiales bacterium]
MRTRKAWTWANWAMAGLFGLSVVVQFNDPDPLRWIVLYGCAVFICSLEARRGAPWQAAAVVALIALIPAALIARGLDAVPVGDLFAEWEMQDNRVEETREVGGLLIVAVWMTIVMVVALARARRRRHTRASATGVAGE